jgi:hypothetical protein
MGRGSRSKSPSALKVKIDKIGNDKRVKHNNPISNISLKTKVRFAPPEKKTTAATPRVKSKVDVSEHSISIHEFQSGAIQMVLDKKRKAS